MPHPAHASDRFAPEKGGRSGPAVARPLPTLLAALTLLGCAGRGPEPTEGEVTVVGYRIGADGRREAVSERVPIEALRRLFEEKEAAARGQDGGIGVTRQALFVGSAGDCAETKIGGVSGGLGGAGGSGTSPFVRACGPRQALCLDSDLWLMNVADGWSDLSKPGLVFGCVRDEGTNDLGSFWYTDLDGTTRWWAFEARSAWGSSTLRSEIEFQGGRIIHVPRLDRVNLEGIAVSATLMKP